MSDNSCFDCVNFKLWRTSESPPVPQICYTCKRYMLLESYPDQYIEDPTVMEMLQ
jgi:hypothetical protein